MGEQGKPNIYSACEGEYLHPCPSVRAQIVWERMTFKNTVIPKRESVLIINMLVKSHLISLKALL